MGRPRPKAKRRPAGKPRLPKNKSSQSASGKKPARRAPNPKSDDPRPRLQKVLAAAGIASRRDCEELILEGRVEIDGQVVRKLGVRVDPDTQKVRLDGNVIRIPRKYYFLVNKPGGVVSTTDDPRRRLRVIDLVPKNTRLFTVGRLDKSSEGLMLVTNDGELANQLAHPRYGIEKTYLVTVAGLPDADALKKLRRGIHLAEGSVRVSGLRVKSRKKQSTVLEMVLTEGKNREIRRMAAAIGHKVIVLRRIGLGPLRLGDIPTGAYRELEPRELKRLRKLVAIPPSKRNRKKSPRGSSSRSGAATKSESKKRTGSRGSTKETAATSNGSKGSGRKGKASKSQKSAASEDRNSRSRGKGKPTKKKKAMAAKGKNSRKPTKKTAKKSAQGRAKSKPRSRKR